MELRHAIAVALDEGGGGLVVPAVAEVGAVTAVGPGAEHRRVVEQVLDLEQRPCLRRLQLFGLGHHS